MRRAYSIDKIKERDWQRAGGSVFPYVIGVYGPFLHNQKFCQMHKFSELFRHDFNTSVRLLLPKSTKPILGNTATEVEVHS